MLLCELRRQGHLLTATDYLRYRAPHQLRVRHQLPHAAVAPLLQGQSALSLGWHVNNGAANHLHVVPGAHALPKLIVEQRATLGMPSASVQDAPQPAPWLQSPRLLGSSGGVARVLLPIVATRRICSGQQSEASAGDFEKQLRGPGDAGVCTWP